MLKDTEKLSVVFDSSGDQPEKFPQGYYIACVLEWHAGGRGLAGEWINTGRVFHVAKLANLDDLLARQ